MTTEEIKLAWEKTKIALEKTEARNIELANVIKNGKKKTALQNLATRYLRFSRIGLVAAIVFGLSFSTHSFHLAHGNRILLVAVMTGFFALASIMDFWLYKGISSIDCSTMNVSEVISKSLFYRKRHFQFIAILFPLAIGLVTYEFFLFSDNEGFVYGGIIGIAVGLAIGLIQLMKFLSDYKTLRE